MRILSATVLLCLCSCISLNNYLVPERTNGYYDYPAIVIPQPVPAVQKESFLPENNLHLEDQYFLSNISKSQFNLIIDAALDIYGPIMEDLGVQLIIERKWDDATVNAYAYQQGSKWYVAMFGGLARRPEITFQGFMTLCRCPAFTVGWITT